MPSCCSLTFKDSSALEQHQEAKHRHCCKQCNRSFSTQISLDQHSRDLHGSPTPGGKKGPSPKQVVGHLQKEDSNCYCGECQKSFVDAAALAHHLRSAAHAVEFRCCDCERSFIDLDALRQHLKDKVHNKARTYHEEKGIQRCPKCSSQFRSEEALRSHQSSVVHRSARNLVCAIGGDGPGGCNRRFRSPSAILHHLESGACPSGMDRATLNALVLRNDTERIVSSPGAAAQGLLEEATRRLASHGGGGTMPKDIVATTWTTGSGDDEGVLTPSSESESARGGVILTPSSTVASSPLASPLLAPSFGSSYAAIVGASGATRCPLCSPARRPFLTRQSLQQHLLSPAHDAKLHCPVSPVFAVAGTAPQGEASTVKQFSTLSGMGQHIESGACVGSGADFSKAVSYLEARLRGLGLVVGRVHISN
ncbi:hypothetical protein B0T25DRAFT_552105 [Lasiosphaeria hispida]|uniref:C2H2-type domain-containing protein n=1 Tax=Lasiosphaeria hispida TaxID=260671 RepID=A0AAJ0HBW3_9PEZI|nr:hypothetical protein B0T25DRAFT_552105 [Lasiosphaeria hispida]